MSLDRRLDDRGLLPSTKSKYKEILNNAPNSDLVEWMRKKVHARTPIGTVLPLRAAVKHYLVGELGYGEDEVDELLPKARGRSAARRDALTPRQLALYHAAVEQLEVEPARTILMLLPQTGLRISEACALHRRDLVRVDNHLVLDLRGKGDKQRVVPLNQAATSTFTSYLRENPQDGFLFLGYRGRPIGPHAVRHHTRRIAAEIPDLKGLSPHILRHTFATMSVRRGVSLLHLKELLGHESITTTQRYTHPSVDDLAAAVRKLDD